jgi:hypothetical protein
MHKRFSGYSPAHDKSKKPEKKTTRKAKPESTLPTQPEIALPRELSEQERRAIRARQLMGMDVPIQNLKPLPDPDLDVQSPRGDQGNIIDGRTVFPMVKGPQPREKMRVLPGDPDLRTGSTNNSTESSDLIAAVSLNDRAILNFDNQMTSTHQALQSLKRSAEAMVQDIRQKDQGQALREATTILELITTVLEPWFLQLEDHLEGVVQSSLEGQTVQ